MFIKYKNVQWHESHKSKIGGKLKMFLKYKPLHVTLHFKGS